MPRFDPDAIYTDAQGRPIERPEKPADLKNADIETKISYMRAVSAWEDKITDAANIAFAKQFSRSVRR